MTRATRIDFDAGKTRRSNSLTKRTGRSILVAGTHSGVGKTTIALALMAALRQRSLVVQPFKVGPDFIDPGHHTASCGRVSRNLDTWMLDEDTVRSTFALATADADIAVIEGVMGLFDGRSANDPRGSTAHIAKLLGAPVVLVVDAGGMAASVAAVVKGFSELDPEIHVAGAICNRVAGAKHYEYLEPAIRRHTKVVPLGWLPRREEWRIPERHLGLVTAQDAPPVQVEALGRALGESVDLDRLLELSGPLSLTGAVWGQSLRSPETGRSFNRTRRRVAVARDAAFCFYYPENLELLERAGGEIVPFSPLTDSSLPAGTDVAYLGGGYPELHAATLAANDAMRQSLRAFHAKGGTIYAECGGLMYACRELVDASGRGFPMLDLLPARTIMQSRRAALGYVTLRTLRPSPLGPAGIVVRGHEFHYSRLELLESLEHVAELEGGRDSRPDGFVSGRLWAGYAHLHFGSNPAVAAALLG
ncbi:MAG: cobyrinate a,c-diamide synthase [Gemmataceae bacterium]|nr:cobyrinate a,c-diamide synthase [Gemmataceae bacterium]